MTFTPETTRALYRKARELPAQHGGQHAYNLIEMIKGDILSAPPLGDHKLQRREEQFRLQVEGLERALATQSDQ